MARPNTRFELTVQDMDLIESALHTQKQALCDQLCEMTQPDEDLKSDLSDIQELLGRLHNQKEFYRPTTAPYVGG
ncbi:hypothetical protein E4Z66_11830 [Aliishimia ponticola]|uniref:Uncharacterized protein n=1 Tax=Aliishimia ponticola TaxID=2499833 RepID=A0A4S4N9D2_9RHOB|nr:hypothetical protein [Aliishimia ponticola]THH35769.1 hypothetical protein E4Z66_11830 [Aliishimia ponticola]